MPSLFGWLDKIPFWRDLPYPTKGALLRAFKAALSVFVSILLTAALGGVLFPVDWSPIIIIALTSILQAVDKFIREWQIEKEGSQADTEEIPEEIPVVVEEEIP